MEAELIVNDENRDWADRIRAAAEMHYKNGTSKKIKKTYKQRPLCLADRAYIARYHDHDGPTSLAEAFGKKHQYISCLVKRMKESGEWETYRNLSDEEYERIVSAAERNGRYAM